MILLDAEKVEEALDYTLLIERLKAGFSTNDYEIPKRHHHNYPNPAGIESTLLMMPAWKSGQDLGVKIVNVTPENGKRGMPGKFLFYPDCLLKQYWI